MKHEDPEDNDDDFLIQEQIRAVVAKRVTLTRSPEAESKVKERLQEIANKRNDDNQSNPPPEPPKRGRPPKWMTELVKHGVMAAYNSLRNSAPGTNPGSWFPASPYEDSRHGMSNIPVDATQRERDREEISAARLDKFRSFVHRLILVESDVGAAATATATTATPDEDEEAQSVLERPPRKRRALVDALSDSLTQPPTYGLRHRLPGPQTPSGLEERATRLARRAKPAASIEKSAPTTLRTHYSAPSQGIFSDSETHDSDEMAEDGDRTPTYGRQYVEKHGLENFYHTGNGWYKRGPRPQTKIKDRRHSDAPTLMRERDGALSSDREKRKSIHKAELQKYPGAEFHHCGNGYFRPGPDPAGKRTSRVVTDPDGEDEDEDGEGAAGGTVSKQYKDNHPEIQWVHRGNGRYMRKADVIKEPAHSPSETPTAPPADSRRKSAPTFDKAYVIAHPTEAFYHTGNARYKRGRRPSGNKTLSEEESEEDGDPTMLYDKAHVLAHPHQVFHHRGQGRYARGPRPIATPARDSHVVEEESEEEEAEDDDEEEPSDDDDMEQSTLVDTSYVDSHPELTFYHKGQGRWARGLPPPGSHNKVAVRGPSAKERMASRGSEEEENEAEMAPAVTALVTKGEGPEKFPTLTWHYRGGGKWGRITKLEASQMTAGTTADHKVSTTSKYQRRSAKTSDGPKRQLQREVPAPADDGDNSGYDDMNMAPGGPVEKPKQRRGRKMHRSHLVPEALGGFQEASRSQPKPAAPPKPRVMLRPEEDIITEEDLPPIFGSNWEGMDTTDDSDVAKAYRSNFKPLNYQSMVDVLTRHSPEVRSMANLNQITAHVGNMLVQLQDEYLKLDKIVAPHAKIPRKPAKGGRVPLEPAIYEDKKEADLYDYAFDSRKIGFQDPEAQRIIRDAEGRELRKRRNRSGIEPTDTVPGWHFGEGTDLAPKRQSRQPNRFDGVIEPSRKRARLTIGTDNAQDAGSMTPDGATTPLLGPGGYRVQTAHVPKRVRELRENSVGSARSQNDGGSETGGKVRKGRPPGSKNLHKRSDAGIKKGPRRPKVVPSIEASPAAGAHASLAEDWEGGAPELADETMAQTDHLMSGGAGTVF